MMQLSHQTSPPKSRVNDIIVGVLTTSVLVLAGILSLAQFMA